MPWDLTVVLLLLAVAIVLFIRNRPRMDVVAVMMMVLLPLSGVITVQEALAGFSDPSVILIAALFIVGEGITRTGIAYQVGLWLTRRAGRSEVKLLAMLMVSVTTLGSIMSSTGIVALFIPVVLSITSRMSIHPGRLMMPLSVAGLISGMMTLVATPPNMILDSALKNEGHEGFSFFSFTPIGVVVLSLSVGYMLIARRWLSRPATNLERRSQRRSLQSFIEEYHLHGRAFRLRIQPGSPLAGHLLRDLRLREQYGANLVGVERQGRFRRELLSPLEQTELRTNDILLVDFLNSEDDPRNFIDQMTVEPLPINGNYFSQQSRSVGMAEVAIHPDSSLIGKTVVEHNFRTVYGLSVIGLRRGGEPLPAPIVDQKLRPGDILLVIGPWKSIHQLQPRKHDLVVLSLPIEVESVAPAMNQAPYALASLTIMVLLMVTGLVPNVLAALIACLLLGLFGCVDIESAYKSIRWQSIILIVGMIPFATALEKTSGIELAVGMLMQMFDGAGIHVVVASLFLLTACFSLFISNTATAVLMAPIALSIAQQMGVSPYPFAMTVAIAASASFNTPMSSPVNTLVIGPGEYQFSDFVKVGVPLTLLVLIICTIMIPWLYG